MTAGSVGVHSVTGMSELPMQTNYIAIRAEIRVREVAVLYSTGQDRILYRCGSECQMFGLCLGQRKRLTRCIWGKPENMTIKKVKVTIS